MISYRSCAPAVAVAAGVALATAAPTASAALVEVESNDTFATAQAIAVPVGSADVGVFDLLPGGDDVDWLTITVPVNSFLLVNTAPIEVPFSAPDTVLAIVDAGGTIVAFDDDEGEGLGSSLTFEVTGAPETLYIAVSGFGDFDSGDVGAASTGVIDGIAAAGPHGEAGDYILTVSVIPVPEPASAALLGLGALCMLRRRR